MSRKKFPKVLAATLALTPAAAALAPNLMHEREAYASEVPPIPEYIYLNPGQNLSLQDQAWRSLNNIFNIMSSSNSKLKAESSGFLLRPFAVGTYTLYYYSHDYQYIDKSTVVVGHHRYNADTNNDGLLIYLRLLNICVYRPITMGMEYQWK